MPKFRADHYLIAEFSKIADTRKVGEQVLEALKGLPEIKDLAIVSKKLEGKSWSEIIGRIDVPAGSREFWAMIKKEFSVREPYHLFICFDMNAEGENIEAARASVRAWIEKNVAPRIRAKTSVKTLKVLQAIEIFMPKFE